jgi:hypothetical protein
MSLEQCAELARARGLDVEAVVEAWTERAAIREYDGGQSRAAAEHDAFDDVQALFETAPLVVAGPRRGPQSAGLATGVAIPAVDKTRT